MPIRFQNIITWQFVRKRLHHALKCTVAKNFVKNWRRTDSKTVASTCGKGPLFTGNYYMCCCTIHCLRVAVQSPWHYVCVQFELVEVARLFQTPPTIDQGKRREKVHFPPPQRALCPLCEQVGHLSEEDFFLSVHYIRTYHWRSCLSSPPLWPLYEEEETAMGGIHNMEIAASCYCIVCACGKPRV